jgi:uncharacterized RDD family membrane protein YckC
MFSILGADGKEYGPVAADKIQAWITGGRANLQTKARREGETEWKTLGDFAEFNGAAAGAPPVFTATVAPGSAADAVTAGNGQVLAGRWQRLGAVILDGILGGLVALPGAGLMIAAGVLSERHNANPALMLPGLLVLGCCALALFGLQCYLLTTRGQTVGKILLGIKIVTCPEGLSPGFVKIVLLRVIVNALIGAVPVVGGVYSLVDACFIFRDDKRCIHDLIAGTQVVNA